VSTIVQFFEGTEPDAVAALGPGPAPHLRAATHGNFDVEEALLDRESRLTGRPVDALPDDDVPRVVAEDDGPVVPALSDALQDGLAALSPAGVEELARWWASESEPDIEPPISSHVLNSAAELVRAGRGQGHGTYCRVC
jgi:hypothetical protein